MSKVIFIDSQKKQEWNTKSNELASKLEFMHRWHDSDNEKMLNYIKENCTPNQLWQLQLELNEIEKRWYRGELVV